jgi:nucleoside-diphosphate-sugar epimerase
MPKHTVGIIGINGNLGSHLFRHIVAAHTAGKLDVVVLHRPSSDVSSVPSGIEKRALDLEKADKAEVQRAVKGLNIIM